MTLSRNRVNLLLFNYAIFAVAMAYLESTIVVYLRLLYYPDGFQFPLRVIPTPVAMVEIGREAATLMMLWFVARMAAKSFKEKFALFIYTFAVWDIFYYIWLKVLLNWPAGLLDWDILFLIPLPWIAPWLAPVIVSLGFIFAAVLILSRPHHFGESILRRPEWLLEWGCVAIILASFFWETSDVLAGQVPDYYPWWLFAAGFLAGLFIFWRRYRLARLLNN